MAALDKCAYILGAGAHARIIKHLVQFSGFVPPEIHLIDKQGESAFFASPIPEDAGVYLGVGDNAVRAKLFARLVELGIRPRSCVATNAFIATDEPIGAGSVIYPGVTVLPGTKIGQNVIINANVGINHDCVIGDHTQISGGCTFAGRVTVGAECFFGLNCGVFPGVTIGNNVVVRAGALVIKGVPDSVVVGGNPAEIIRQAL